MKAAMKRPREKERAGRPHRRRMESGSPMVLRFEHDAQRSRWQRGRRNFGFEPGHLDVSVATMLDRCAVAPQELLPIMPPNVQLGWVAGSGPCRNPYGAS